MKDRSRLWWKHRRDVPEWADAVEPPRRLGGPFQMWWHCQNWRDGLSVG